MGTQYSTRHIVVYRNIELLQATNHVRITECSQNLQINELHQI